MRALLRAVAVTALALPSRRASLRPYKLSQHQYASALGKTANCQSLVSVTLASREVPVMVGLRLFLPETWTNDPERMTRGHVPKDRQIAQTKPEIAIEEIDRVISSGTVKSGSHGAVPLLRFRNPCLAQRRFSEGRVPTDGVAR